LLGPGEPDEETKKAVAKVTAAASREGYEPPKAEGKGTYLVSFGHGWPPQAVEADGPAEAARAAAELLGILRWERQPDLVKVE
jgi:hypothetical protein